MFKWGGCRSLTGLALDDLDPTEILSTSPDVEVVGKAADGEEALQVMEKEPVRVIVSDWADWCASGCWRSRAPRRCLCL